MGYKSQLDTLIASLGKLDKTLVQAAAPDLAKALEQHLHSTIAASTDAFGEAWKPKLPESITRRRPNTKPLQGAAKKLIVSVVGNLIVSSC
jgi:hypothetical protein